MNPTPEQAALHTMTEAFLRWPLPDSVCADLCTTKQGPGRVGTNLLTVIEAEQMLKEVVMPLFIEFKHARLATRQIDWDFVEFLQRVQNGEMTCIKAAQYINAKIESENARLQAALAEKEAEHANVKRDRDYIADHWAIKCQELEAQLAASQQRVASLECQLKAAVDREGGGVGQLLSDATEEVQLARAAQKQAEADRDRMKAALEAVTNYGVELGAMYNAVMTKASHDLPINDAFSLADASAKVQSGPFSLTNAMNYFKQVKALLGATEYNKITGANDTKIAALATPAAQAATEETK